MEPSDVRPTDPQRAESPLPLAERIGTLRRSLLRELIGVVSRPGVLSLAGGLPDPWLFPVTHYAAALAEVLANDDRALQYGPTWGPLREEVVRIMAVSYTHLTLPTN